MQTDWQRAGLQITSILDNTNRRMIDSMMNGTFELKDIWKSFWNDLLGTMKNTLVQMATASVSSGLGNIFGDILGSMFGSAAGGASSQTNTALTSSGAGNFKGLARVPLQHDGGITGLEASAMRDVPMSIFNNAKRYHGGGFPSLRSDEVPTILQKGEGVFTKEQMKAMGGGGNVQVNVINQSGQPMNAEQSQPRFDGEKMVLDVVLRNMQKPGHFRDGVKGALG